MALKSFHNILRLARNKWVFHAQIHMIRIILESSKELEFSFDTALDFYRDLFTYIGGEVTPNEWESAINGILDSTFFWDTSNQISDSQIKKFERLYRATLLELANGNVQNDRLNFKAKVRLASCLLNVTAPLLNGNTYEFSLIWKLRVE